MSREQLSYGQAGGARRGLTRPSFGQTVPADLIQAVQPDAIRTLSSFAGGYVSADADEDLQKDSSPFMVDFEISRRDSLIVSPGVRTLEVEPFNVESVLVHSDLDHTSELLMFAPPFLGIKQIGLTIWTDEGLPTRGSWVSANYAGALIFTNGRGQIYAREPHGAHPFVISAPVGRTLAAWNNRLWIGNAVIGGNYLPLGIAWSSAEGSYEDFTGFGAGFEELIYDFSDSDWIVAFRPMSYDYMAILMRKSLWIAQRTDSVEEPGQFMPRETGLGCVSERTARQVLGGIAYLSEQGVEVFDGNRSTHVSAQIDSDLVPLDLDRIDAYWAHYNTKQRRYYLGTPTCTWVYDIGYNRWYRRSFVVTAGVNFPEQPRFLAWDDLGTSYSTWADMSGLTWDDFSGEGGTDRNLFVSGAMLGVEDEAVRTYFDRSFTPEYRLPADVTDDLDGLLRLRKLGLRYKGRGRIGIYSADEAAELVSIGSRDLPDTLGKWQTRTIPIDRVGSRMQAHLKLLSGTVEVSRIAMHARPAGRGQGSL